jgi:hypothetical protein
MRTGRPRSASTRRATILRRESAPSAVHPGFLISVFRLSAFPCDHAPSNRVRDSARPSHQRARGERQGRRAMRRFPNKAIVRHRPSHLSPRSRSGFRLGRLDLSVSASEFPNEAKLAQTGQIGKRDERSPFNSCLLPLAPCLLHGFPNEAKLGKTGGYGQNDLLVRWQPKALDRSSCHNPRGRSSRSTRASITRPAPPAPEHQPSIAGIDRPAGLSDSDRT